MGTLTCYSIKISVFENFALYVQVCRISNYGDFRPLWHDLWWLLFKSGSSYLIMKHLWGKPKTSLKCHLKLLPRPSNISNFSCQNDLHFNVSDHLLYFINQWTGITRPKICYWLKSQLQQTWHYSSSTKNDETITHSWLL